MGDWRSLVQNKSVFIPTFVVRTADGPVPRPPHTPKISELSPSFTSSQLQSLIARHGARLGERGVRRRVLRKCVQEPNDVVFFSRPESP